MSQETPPAEESALVIESGLSPIRSIETASMVANVRGKISYTIMMVGSRRWKVKLTGGAMEDLRKAVAMAKGVKIIE
jgi:hypothetical protein